MSHATGAATMERSEGAETRVAKRNQSFFDIYKKGQGYYTRMGTTVGAGILAAGFADFLFDRLSFDPSMAAGIWLQNGIPALVLVLLGLGIYWFVWVHRRTCDFLIATDGEMKKVNWTSRKEIIAATKVVIVVTFLTAIILFMVDYGFMQMFRWIGVLRGQPD